MKCNVTTPCGSIWVYGSTESVVNISWEHLGDDTSEHSGELDWFITGFFDYLNGNADTVPGYLSFKNGMPLWVRYRKDVVHPVTLKEHVLKKISEIPYGSTKTYGLIGKESGSEKYARAVGSVCSGNPLVIAVPCHRVVAASSIGGYSSGLLRKRYLLNIEGIVA